ncbi:hypothetical protein MMC31_007375, partial [Peltigera leucophlebia]|nr:hypothetical protein [Peltigera leucophlebia]
GQSFYQCPGSNPPTYCCHQQNCNCANGGDFKLPPVAQISLIKDPPKSSVILPPVTQTLTVINSQTIINNLVSVVETNAPTQLVSVILTNAAAAPTSLVLVTYTNTPVLPSLVSVTITNTPLSSTISQQSTPSSQSTNSQSSGVVNEPSGAAAPAKSGARKLGIDFIKRVVALTISALVLFVLQR